MTIRLIFKLFFANVFLWWFCTVSVCVAETALAEDQDLLRLDAGLSWEYCGSPPNKSKQTVDDADPTQTTPIAISADGAEFFRLEDQVLLRGNVEADRGNQHMESDFMTYERKLGIVRSPGPTLLTRPEIRIIGNELQVDLQKNQLWLEQANYRLIGNNARGTAQAIFIEDQDNSHYEAITYTTCPRGDTAWEIHAADMNVDREAGRVVAWNAHLRIADIPILYTPYFSMPLDDRRQSGFLIPSLGSSKRLGFNFTTPYYWNIDPQLDATFYPRFMSNHGVMLGNETRYLTTDHHGSFKGEILPSDSGRADDGPRSMVSIKHTGRFDEHLTTDIDFNVASDADYLDDFADELQITSVAHLQKRADLRYQGQGWSILGRLQGFQTMDDTIPHQDRPYSQLPQILFRSHKIPIGFGLNLDLTAENVYFQHEHKVHGDRLALAPSISLPISRPYGHLTPRLTLNHTTYWLTEQQNNTDPQRNNTVPILSFDAGVEFERNIDWFGKAATQTLEPRIYYLYAPYQDQDTLPIFDSAEFDFYFSSLFRENRFSGRDRFGDANQITLGLTSRTIADTTGWELLRISVGEIFYFADRRVQLAGADDVDSGSAILTELSSRISQDWNAWGNIMWDPNQSDNQTRRSVIGVRYKNSHQQLVNVSHSLNESDVDTNVFENTKASFNWPLGSKISVVGNWLYSHHYNQTMEAFAGLQYGSCCWRMRGLIRHVVHDITEDPDLSFMLQLELTGLGEFGDEIDKFLRVSMPGY